MKPGERCSAVVLDDKRRAKLCLLPATEERTIEGVDMTLCGFHAEEWDTTASKTGQWSGKAAPLARSRRNGGP